MDILGTFEGCTRVEMDVISLYCMFVEPDFCNPVEDDEGGRQLVPPPEGAWCNVYDKVSAL
jgi:hypothetical protein